MIAIGTLKAFLKHPDEPGVTALLTTLETMAVQLVEDETGRFFGASETRTEYLIGDGTRKLHLAENATAITSVGRRRLVGDSFDAITEGDDDGFEIRAPRAESGRATLLRKAGLGWTIGFEFRVIYAFGYTAGAEPVTIRQAVMDIVALKYHTRGLEGLKSISAGGVTRIVKGDATKLTFDGRDILAVPGLSRTLGQWKTRTMVLQ